MEIMTLKQLKTTIAALEASGVGEDTPIFLDTGWDSIQELDPDALTVKQARPFQIQDVLTKEYYGGFVLEEKAHTKETTGDKQDVLVFDHKY
ncbi:hypothetical protein [Enterococcus bulliens]|uniref:hypothetical protein n=1 Tax=uncultured Enterococcus sp. TaxID=167972 RepID=UPI0025F5028A|nr:hypothetical protein [uncultured Enterococcus sp.]